MVYDVQIDKEVYSSRGYLSAARWSTYARIVTEVLRIKPARILEIGPGNRLLADTLQKLGFQVTTMDHNPAVQPGIVMDITDPQLSELAGKFDLVIAAEVLEHITYEDALIVLGRLRGITPRLLLTLPYTSERSRLFSFSLKLPGFRPIRFIKKLFFGHAVHTFNGQHYWEIGKKGFGLSKIRRDFSAAGWAIERDFLNPDNTYHYFFILNHS